MKTYIVQLDNQDDVLSVRDKISWSKAKRVLLVWPRRGVVLTRQVDLLLVQRYCSQLGAQLGLVTDIGEVKSIAADLGIPVFGNPIQAQQSTWHRPRGSKLNDGVKLDNNRQPLNPQKLREERLQFKDYLANKLWLRVAMFCAGVFAFLSLVLFFAPGARVIVTPTQETRQISLPVRVQPGITVVNPSGVVPAHTITVIVAGRDQIQTTSRTLIPDKSAQGEVTVTNLTDQQVIIPQGSIVLTIGENPIRYMTTRDVQVVGEVGAIQVVPIQAVFPGTNGNVSISQIQAFEGPLGLKIAVENIRPIRGGTDRTSPAASEQDYRNLIDKMLLDLRTIALDEMKAKIKPGERLIEESIRIGAVIDEKREPAVSQPADWLQLAIQVEFEAWYVEEDDLHAIAYSALNANLPKDYNMVPESLKTDLQISLPSSGVNPINLTVAGKLSAETQLKPTFSRNKIIKSLTGKKLTDAIEIIEDRLPLSRPVLIETYPVWWSRMPFLSFRIQLEER